MIIKSKSIDNPLAAQLEALATDAGVPKTAARRIKKDLAMLKSGDRNEHDCAHYLDPLIKDHPGRVILHDLRLQVDGEVCQIDHLLINRGMEFFVLESKSYGKSMRINDRGEFEYLSGRSYIGMPSPIEQVKRQARILNRLATEYGLLPKRLGLSIKPKLCPFVLVATKSRIVRPKRADFDTDCVIKADRFMSEYQAEIDRDFTAAEVLKQAVRIVSKNTIVEIGRALVAMHRPAEHDLAKKYGLSDDLFRRPGNNGGAQPDRVREASPPKLARNPAKRPALKRPARSAPVVKKPPSPTAKAHGVPKVLNPPCPRCDETMVIRTAKRGENKGGQFWGCPRYPQCRGIMALSAVDEG